MKYMGSKRRIAKRLRWLMMPHVAGRDYIEPFVGGGNMISAMARMTEQVSLVDAYPLRRFGYDANQHTIDALTLIRDRPTDLPRNNVEFTEEDYNRVKEEGHPDPGIYAVAMFAYSFGGIWGGTFARGNDNNGVPRDFVRESYDNAQRQSPTLQGVHLECASYDDVTPERESLIYCDPPYRNTEGYATGDFDHDAFWSWAHKMAQDHVVFVSEYSAPDGVECVWSHEISMNIDRNQSDTRTERLYRVRP